jgi:membrane fusion protein, multidrug efflux system
MDPSSPLNEAPPAPDLRRWAVPGAIAAAAAAVLIGGGLLYWRATSGQNHVALASRPKGVTVVEAQAATYRGSRRYVATIEPWVHANVGPQLVAAYVDTVLVRPGAIVKRGDVLATLDCRNTSAGSNEVAMRARSLEAKQTALAKESARVSSLLKGGFVSPNDVDQKEAETASMEAQLLATRAKLQSTSLEVNDCVLRAPFDGEVALRMMDPGAFVRPGQSIVSLVDRSTVRIAADVPEGDFEAVSTGVEVRVRMLAAGRLTHAAIARRPIPRRGPSTSRSTCPIRIGPSPWARRPRCGSTSASPRRPRASRSPARRCAARRPRCS